MSDVFSVDAGEIHNEDCLSLLRRLPDSSIDSIVTDPPYGLKFMGRKWDYSVPSVEVWSECLRVLKPGGHLLSFAAAKTQHRMAVNIEDAGFEIRDMIAWVYSSGMPKTMDVSRAIGKGAGDAARQWHGWGTALKPAIEPITMARKPLIGTVAENVLEHGTGGLNIDGCRIACDGESPSTARRESARRTGNAPMADRLYGDGKASTTNSIVLFRRGGSAEVYCAERESESLGRWPANLIHDGSDEVVGLFPSSNGSGSARTLNLGVRDDGLGMSDLPGELRDAGSGSAARFFYCAKASKSEKTCNGSVVNRHPTVKPLSLMQYLVRLVTPPGGIVLDPFCGSGTTLVACIEECFRFIGCEQDTDSFRTSCERVSHHSKKASLRDFTNGARE